MVRVLAIDRTCSLWKKFSTGLIRENGIEFIGYANSVTEAVIKANRSDLVLVDVNQPEDGAYRLVKSLRNAQLWTQVLIVGPMDEKPQFVRCLEAGAKGYFPCEASVEEFVDAIHRIYAGGAALPADMVAALIDRLAELSAWYENIRPAPEITAMLTRREREVLYLMAKDFTNQDIANQLIIELGTVKNHVHNILAKLKVNSRREAASRLYSLHAYPQLNSPPNSLGMAEHYVMQ